MRIVGPKAFQMSAIIGTNTAAIPITKKGTGVWILGSLMVDHSSAAAV